MDGLYTEEIRGASNLIDYQCRKVNAAYPEHSIFGEEKVDKKEHSGYVWVCDPIDGTMPFSCGLPIFTFSLALVDQLSGQPILGLVNDPVMKNMYWAYKGGGAYRNGNKIAVTKDASLRNTYVNTDVSGKDVVGFSVPLLLKVLGEKKCWVLKLLSIIYGGIQVANGKFAGTVFFGPYAHDVAALYHF